MTRRTGDHSQMKHRLFSLALLALPFVLGCGDEAASFVSTSDPNALSQAIVIPGATRIEGQPPSPSGGENTPMISGDTSIMTTSGDQAVVEVMYNSPTGYQNCYVQVIGADDYFLITDDVPAATGTIQIPINIPGNVDTGSFDLYTCIAGADGAVSNALTTGFGVTRSSGAGGSGGSPGGNLICASDNPEVGQMFTCPGGGVLDFCIDQSNNNCFYRVGNQTANCGDCVNDQNAVASCVEQAVALCL